jgi:hypothetical protein
MNYVFFLLVGVTFSKATVFTMNYALFFKNHCFYNELYTMRLGAILGPCWHREGSMPEPSRAEPGRAGPSRAEPSRAEPGRAGPGIIHPQIMTFFPRAGYPLAVSSINRTLPYIYIYMCPGNYTHRKRWGPMSRGACIQKT